MDLGMIYINHRMYILCRFLKSELLRLNNTLDFEEGDTVKLPLPPDLIRRIGYNNIMNPNKFIYKMIFYGILLGFMILNSLMINKVDV